MLRNRGYDRQWNRVYCRENIPDPGDCPHEHLHFHFRSSHHVNAIDRRAKSFAISRLSEQSLNIKYSLQLHLYILLVPKVGPCFENPIILDTPIPLFLLTFFLFFFFFHISAD